MKFIIQIKKLLKRILPKTVGAVTTVYLGEYYPQFVAALSGIVTEEILTTMSMFKEKEKQSSLSSMEKDRLEMELKCILSEINKNIDKENKIRQDNFFTKEKNDRSSAQELLEGTLYAAIYEYEQKKITYYAYLFTNIIYNENISREDANYLLTLSKSFSYRELCIIAILKDGIIMPEINEANIHIFQEIYSLYKDGICYSEDKDCRRAILSYGNMEKMNINLDYTGNRLFELMNLDLLLNTEEVNTIRNKLKEI